VRGPLPDAGCTPGTRFSRATKAEVCRSGYSQSVRSVSQSTKGAVYRAYGMSRHFDGRSDEVDHLVSLELGGTNARSNLFPEAATPRPGSHEKDKLEEPLAFRGLLRTHHAEPGAAPDRDRLGRGYRERFG
jgi:hypothetical protein